MPLYVLSLGYFKFTCQSNRISFLDQGLLPGNPHNFLVKAVLYCPNKIPKIIKSFILKRQSRCSCRDSRRVVICAKFSWAKLQGECYALVLSQSSIIESSHSNFRIVGLRFYSYFIHHLLRDG